MNINRVVNRGENSCLKRDVNRGVHCEQGYTHGCTQGCNLGVFEGDISVFKIMGKSQSHGQNRPK